MKILPILFAILFSTLYTSTIQGQSTEELNEYFKPVKYRNIGPFRGGRSVTASGVIGDPLTYYMGTTGGGLWKTDDAGQYWKNISDGFFNTGSVGAVTVSESHPNVVYCGMGEHAPRGVMTSHGDGIYKSTDAGKTWKHIGLQKTQHISRIVIHPTNPDIVYIAAQGALHGPNEDRGVFKSIDGGKTWNKVLYVDEKSGCAELSMDMNNPMVLYAAMWEHQRVPWKVVSGGPGSGLYKSIDAGETWTELNNGLPKEMGKMAITVSRANPDKVYALIESDTNKDQGGLFASTDAGNSWNKVSGDNRLTQRAWYYIEVFADPVNEHTLYVLSAPALRSIDGGKTWERITGTHGDYHDLWINPNNPKNLCIANDGGAAISFNHGKSWSTQANMPTSQFYRVNVDNDFPYNIYGGQQDNTSVKIASRALGGRGITERNWTASAGGESAFLAFDPDHPQYVLGGSYLGTINVLDTKAKAGTGIMSAPIQYLGMEARQMKYLYNWNAPIIWSQHEPNTYYHGAQYLLKTKDMGQSWTEVSPDLTRNIDAKQGNGGGPYTNEAVGAENYGTLSYIAESPHEKGVIWTGSDDGFVQITRDGGATWTNVTPKNLKECLINAIEVSPHDPGTAYIATTRYKFDDKTPGLYKTSNYGKSWTAINSGIPNGAFTRVVREDTERPGLLIAGTEIGMYISYDNGAHWNSFQLNMPVTPILDLIIKHDDLVIATSGRSFWVLDDMGLIRQYNGANTKNHLYKPETAYLANGGSELNSTNLTFKGTNPTRGVNPANGVVIYYNVQDNMDTGTVTLQIADPSGKIINTYSSQKNKNFKKYDGGPSSAAVLSKKSGLNRFVWDMRNRMLPGVDDTYIEGSYRGHKVGPGNYNLQLTIGNQVLNSECTILPNPLYPSDIDYSGYDKFMSEMEYNITEMHNMTNSINNKSIQLKQLNKKLKDDDAAAVKTQITSLLKSIKEWDDKMVQRKSKAYDDVENFPNKFTANYLYLINQTESDIPRVNEGSKNRRIELDQKWIVLKSEGEKILNEEIPAINKLLFAHNIGAIWEE